MEQANPSSGKTTNRSKLEKIRFPARIPYYAQVASPEWAGAVFDTGVDPGGDPRWAEWQARDAQEYAHWCSRACGAVCVKMCVEAFGGPVRPVMGWIREGMGLDGYEVKIGADGQAVEVGWKHAGLVALIAGVGLYARSMRIAIREIPAQLNQGRLIIASVSYELGTDREVTRRGGHLVVVTGAEVQGGHVTSISIHNPSGRTEELRENARIPARRFAQAYTGRGIIVSANPIIAGAAE